MATTEEIAALRLLIADTEEPPVYDDELLGGIIDTEGTVKAAAAQVWTAKAAGFATLVNVSESGSSRSLGDLHQNALRMAAALGAEDTSEVSGATGIRIRRIVRP